MRILFDRFITPDTTLTRKLSLGSDWIARRIARRGNWNKIRVGLHYAFVDQGINIPGTPRFYIGMGTWLKGIGNYNSHFIGVRTASTSWTRNVTSGISTFTSVNFVASTVVGQTESTAGSSNTVVGDNHVSRRFALVLDIDKTSPSAVAISLLASNNSGIGAYDFTYDMFLDAMEQTTPSSANHTLNVFPSTLSVNEAANGPLDSVNVAWSRTNFPLEISGLAVGYYDAFS